MLAVGRSDPDYWCSLLDVMIDGCCIMCKCLSRLCYLNVKVPSDNSKLTYSKESKMLVNRVFSASRNWVHDVDGPNNEVEVLLTNIKGLQKVFICLFSGGFMY